MVIHMDFVLGGWWKYVQILVTIAQHCEYTKAFELYILKWWISYVNYILIKKWSEKNIGKNIG